MNDLQVKLSSLKEEVKKYGGFKAVDAAIKNGDENAKKLKYEFIAAYKQIKNQSQIYENNVIDDNVKKEITNIASVNEDKSHALKKLFIGLFLVIISPAIGALGAATYSIVGISIFVLIATIISIIGSVLFIFGFVDWRIIKRELHNLLNK